jgi:hypothetical protein
MTQIVALVGSLRAGSINRQLTEAAVQHAPEGIELSVFDGIVDLPFYNEDIDGDTPPEAAVAFRRAIADADGVLLVTPEYNGTMPAVLKNALDWASRPFGASPLSGKPLAVIGSAFGQYGVVVRPDAGPSRRHRRREGPAGRQGRDPAVRRPVRRDAPARGRRGRRPRPRRPDRARRRRGRAGRRVVPRSRVGPEPTRPADDGREAPHQRVGSLPSVMRSPDTPATGRISIIG